jgi:hypothetical protein
MDSAELIQDNIRALEESVQYYSSQNKTEREKWVAITFITNLNIEFDDSELQIPKQDPPDVIFRDAEFEIKEILDPNRRRHDEYKKALYKARTIKDPQELLSQYRPIDKTITDIYLLCLEKTQALATKYTPSVCASTDLLYYVNLQHIVGLKETPYPDTKELSELGWRTVSFVIGHRSCVLTTSSNAPSFLVKSTHLIHHRNYG